MTGNREYRKEVHGTVFDDVFRTMAQKMPQLLIPLINEVFRTDYSEDEEFQQYRNEHEEAFGKVITDSIIVIRKSNTPQQATRHLTPRARSDVQIHLHILTLPSRE